MDILPLTTNDSFLAAGVIAAAFKWFAGAGVGLFTGWVTDFMKAQQDKRDKAHEIQMYRLQLEYAEKRGVLEIADHVAMGNLDLDELKVVMDGPKPTGIRRIDILNGLLRPYAGFSAIFAFCAFTCVLLMSMMADLWSNTISYKEAMDIFQKSIIADTIMSVWGFTFTIRQFRTGRS